MSCEKENKKLEKSENILNQKVGILLIVPVRIYGTFFRALVDSGEYRCFMSPKVLQTAQL